MQTNVYKTYAGVSYPRVRDETTGDVYFSSRAEMVIHLPDMFEVQLFSCTHALSTNHALSLMSSVS